MAQTDPLVLTIRAADIPQVVAIIEDQRQDIEDQKAKQEYLAAENDRLRSDIADLERRNTKLVTIGLTAIDERDDARRIANEAIGLLHQAVNLQARSVICEIGSTRVVIRPTQMGGISIHEEPKA